MIFTQKKFRLIGARARIKKVFHIVEDLIPAFQTPTDVEIIPTYLDYLVSLNSEAKSFRFSASELDQLVDFRYQLVQWLPEDAPSRREPFSGQRRREIAKLLLKLRHFFAQKIQQPLKESSLIILERDMPPPEPLVWPQDVVVVLDHLRSPYNVGAVLRTMECVGLHRLISLGYTPRLDARQVRRAAMGCDAMADVEYADDGVAAINALREQQYQIYVLETIVPATSVFELPPNLGQDAPIALVIGNEEFGVDESIIALADHLVYIPTFGQKNSLNVSIAFSIAIYQFWSAVFK